jgi:hypothetical protein
MPTSLGDVTCHAPSARSRGAAATRLRELLDGGADGRNPLWSMGFLSVVCFVFLLLASAPFTPDDQTSALWWRSAAASSDSSIAAIVDAVIRGATGEPSTRPHGDWRCVPRTCVVVSREKNIVVLVTNGVPALVCLCSTGLQREVRYTGYPDFAFGTPAGAFRVISKRNKPIWRKPDWAYLEEGLTPPDASDPARLDPTTLGARAISIGGGVYIHGTAYEHLLGKPVSHGCIRVPEHALKEIYSTVQRGTPVLIN